MYICMCVCCQHFQTSPPQKPLGRLKPNFIWSLHGIAERKFVQTVLVTWPRWPPCPYKVKILKKSCPSEPKDRWPWNLQHRVLMYYQIYPNDDSGFTLTYFTARSDLVPCAFVWEKCKTMDFSETIVGYDLKLAIDDRSDKKFPLISTFCHLGAICPLHRGYIHLLNYEKYLYKIRLQRDFFETCNKWVKW